MYNLYDGKTGQVRRVEDKAPAYPAASPCDTRRKPPEPLFAKPSAALGKILSELETEDIILLLVIYLLYRESRDEELLIMLGSLLLP